MCTTGSIEYSRFRFANPNGLLRSGGTTELGQEVYRKISAVHLTHVKDHQLSELVGKFDCADVQQAPFISAWILFPLHPCLNSSIMGAPTTTLHATALKMYRFRTILYNQYTGQGCRRVGFEHVFSVSGPLPCEERPPASERWQLYRRQANYS